MFSFDLKINQSLLEICPRKWQYELINLVRRRLCLESSHSRDLLIHAGPGAGKTFGSLLSFKAMKKEGLLKRFIVFCHRNSIASQWKSSSESIGLRVDFIDAETEHDIPKECDGLLFTYQGASRRSEGFLDKIKTWSLDGTIAIADEAHHLGINPEEPEGQAWGRSFLEISQFSRIRLGLTGTPFRADNLAFCSGRKVCVHSGGELVEQITPDLCISPMDLIKEGNVRPLEFHFQDGLVEHARIGDSTIDVSSMSNESRESWRARNLRRATSISDQSSIALNLLIRARQKLEKVRLNHENAAGLVIARDIDHAVSIASILRENGDSVELVHSNERNASDRLLAFKNGDSQWLVSVDMCSEGFDAPRLRVVAYLTTVVTKARFIQAITRAVRVSICREPLESIPRDPSYVFAPADPLLMEYARSWSIAKPYLIRINNSDNSMGTDLGSASFISLPMEAINHQSGEIIRMRTLELPDFLKR